MDKKKITSIVIMVVGLLALVAGIIVLVVKLNTGPSMADGEYLVSAGEWTLAECGEKECERVVWNFTEIGKGKLTTNAHENDYDFAWAIEDGKLKVRTNWLYEMDNEYNYTLNRDDAVLTLASGEVEYRFTAEQ